MVQKFMVENSGVEKFMVEKSGVERSGVEGWGWKVQGWDVLQPYNFQLESSNVYAFCSSSGFVALASSAFASFPSSSPSFRPILLRNILIVVSLYWLTACYWLKPRTSNFLLSHWRTILRHYSKASGYTVSSLWIQIPWGQLNLHINPV